MKTRISFRILTLFILLISFTLKSNATDLRVADFIPPYSVFEVNNSIVLGIPDDEVFSPMAVVVENVNVLTAVNYTVIVTVKNRDRNTVFRDTIHGSNLAPYTSDTLFTKNWELRQSGLHYITTTIVFDDDIKPSNNSVTWANYVVPTLKRSTDWLSSYLRASEKHLLYETGDLKVPVYAPPKPLAPGTVISHRPPGEDSIKHDTLNFFSWFFYLPHFISDKFVQPAELVIVNAEDETVTSMSTELPPSIDGIPYLWGSWEKIDSKDQVLGPKPKVDTVQDINTVQQEKTSTPPKKDSICALIVSGTAYNIYDSNSFGLDRKLMKNNLMLEQYGPKLKESQIDNIDYAPASLITSRLNSYKGKCDIIYFFFSGHGYKGGLATVGGGLSYEDLAKALYETGAKEFRVIIDACHSGSSESAFRGSDIFKDRNLTLLTSSSSDKISFSTNLVKSKDTTRYNPGVFTINLLKCFGDPRADANGDGTTSLEESFNCLRILNPMQDSGRINKVQNPQIIQHRVYRAEEDEKTVMVPEQRIELKFKEALDQEAIVKVEEVRTIEDTSTDDTSIVGFSTFRFFTIQLLNHVGPFNVDIKFNMDPEKDELPNTEGEPGIVKRDNAGTKWQKVESEQDPESGEITAKNVSSFSDFAFALFSTVSATGFEESLADQGTFSMYPNPATDLLTLDFSLNSAAPVHIEIIDITGRSYLKKDYPGNYGRNQLKLDLKVPGMTNRPGIYLIKLRTGDTEIRRQFLLK